MQQKHSSTQISNRPRILHLFNAYDVGGVERQHMLLLERLTDFEHVCWSYNHGPLEAELDALGIPHCSGDASTLATLLSRSSFDGILVRTNRYIREIAPLLKSAPAAVIYFRNFIRWFEGNSTFFDEELEALALSMADHCFFSGSLLKKPVMEAGLSVPGGELFYNGIDCSLFPLKPRALPGGRPIKIGMLGNILRRKNQRDAVVALHELMQAGEVAIRIGGAEQDKEYAAELHEAADGFPVFFDGYVADSARFMSEIDMLLMSSTIEGWPNVIMEAFASGLPVVSSDVGDIREEFGPNPPGYLFESEQFEKIPTLVKRVLDKDNYSHLSRQAVERASQFDINVQAQILSNAIHETIRRCSMENE